VRVQKVKAPKVDVQFQMHMGGIGSSSSGSSGSSDSSASTNGHSHSNDDCKDVRHYREHKDADAFNCRLQWISALGQDIKLKLDKDDEWHYVLGLTATRPHAHDDSRSSCSGWWDSLGDWHDQDSWFSHFRNRSSWSEGECSDDWRDYRSGHHHHARDEKAWNFFYEEFETVGYLIDSEWSFPESTCEVEDWLSEY